MGYEYHYTLLRPEEQNWYRIALPILAEGGTEVAPVPGIDANGIHNATEAIYYDHPELYYVELRGYRMVSTLEGIACAFHMSVADFAREALTRAVEEKAAEILQRMEADRPGDPYHQVKWIHDYMVHNVKYNHDAAGKLDRSPDARTILGVFVYGEAVCSGIARAFKYLCDRIGVDCIITTGHSALERQNGKHGWNIVRLGNQWTHIDVTWDISFMGVEGLTRYDYFCLPDWRMRLDHDYNPIYPQCTDDSLSWFAHHRRDFREQWQIQMHLEDQLRKGRRLFYFRLDVPPKGNPDRVIREVTKLVQEAGARYRLHGYQIGYLNNSYQMCIACLLTPGQGRPGRQGWWGR